MTPAPLFTPLAGTTSRRRLYLLRHGHVAYYDADGRPLNPKLAALTERGRAEARAAGALLATVPLDRVLCSGLPHTCIFRRKAPSGNGGKRPGRTVKAPSRFGEFAHP
ncbi:phosphoglycerate mutase family protein (plasmid) [Azospirillum sp. B510]|nr:histidine phosphatase family protein [Azospirillum sp. B510]BAI74891.1 phosphoglycerate mutase family protein [Azospirillum sp. B510]